jgi:hypothetical protein
LKSKNKHALIRKLNPTSNEKYYRHPTFLQYKKSHINLFSHYSMEKKLNKRKENKIKEEKNKIENILK